MYTPENLPELLGKRFKTSLDDRSLFIYHSLTYKSWGIYLAVEERPYHSTLEHVSAETVCDWLNNPNYTVKILY
jgi:hypothetical protein